METADQALPGTFQLGDWLIDGDSLSASCGTVRNTLEPRAYQVLRYLAARPGKLVSIDELMDAHWAGTVVTPNAVTRVIAQLRKALDDDAKHPTHIETVARTGYRLIATIGPAPMAVGSRDRRRQIVVGVITLLLLTSVAFWQLWPQPTREPTIAVLPFDNFTGDPSLAYLGDGLAEEILNSLAAIDGLQVSARSLSFLFRGTDLQPPEVADKLNVNYLVEGSVRRDGERLRFTAQLIEANSGYHLWSRTSEHHFDDIFAGQDVISAELASALVEEFGLPPVSAMASGEPRPHPQAYDLYLRGRFVWHRRGNEPLQPAIDDFAEATRIDPEFARGWAALASAYLTYPSYSPKGFKTWALAEELAHKAIDLDPTLPEPYAVLGTFAQTRRQWQQAEEYFREGVRHGPRNVTANFWLSEHLMQTGHVTASLEQLRVAIELDPVYLPLLADVAWANLKFGDVAEGRRLFRELWDKGFQGPECWVGNLLAALVQGDLSDAREWIKQAPHNQNTQDFLDQLVDIEAGDYPYNGFVESLIDSDGPYPDHRSVMWVAGWMGRFDSVFEVIRWRIEHGYWVDMMVLWGPPEEIRMHSEFANIVDELGLVDFWNEVGWGDVCRQDGEAVICDARDVDLSSLTPTILAMDRAEQVRE